MRSTRRCASTPLRWSTGEEIVVDGLALRVVTTQATADSVSLVLPGDGALLTGDMVLGRGTTVVAHPDGQLAPYFSSIERMRSLVVAGEVRTLWPPRPGARRRPSASGLLPRHRRERLAQVERALAELSVPLSPELAEDPALPRRVVGSCARRRRPSLWDAAGSPSGPARLPRPPLGRGSVG